MIALRDVVGLRGKVDSSQACRIPSEEPKPHPRDWPQISEDNIKCFRKKNLKNILVTITHYS